MIKGKSRIQLFDARTGEKQGDYSNKNLITNAVSKILNQNDDLGLWRHAQAYYSANESYGTDSTFNPLKTACPLATNAFGGVYLFGSTIAENTNTVMPPANTPVIGYAGGNYSGSDVFRGAYNTNESGVTTDGAGNITGYRHVWDFGTDKANGTINCLGLTSQHGGNFGLGANQSGEQYMPYTYNYFGSANSYLTINSYTNVTRYPQTNKGIVFYIAKNADGTLTMLTRGYTDKTKIFKAVINPTSVIKLTDSYNAILSETAIISGINANARVYVYNGVIHEIYATAGATTITHKTYSLTGALQNAVTVTAPSAISNTYNYYCIPFFFNGYYYYVPATSATTINKITAAGVLTSTLTIPSSVYTWFRGIYVNEALNLVEIFMHSNANNANTVNLLLIGDDDSVSVSTTNDFVEPGVPIQVTVNFSQFAAKSVLDCFNYLVYGMSSMYPATLDAANIICLLDMRYLASINNLAVPVTKTSAQVMKITYELTETT